MSEPQSGILEGVPGAARYLLFRQATDSDPRDALRKLAAAVDGNHTVAALGLSLIQSLGAEIPGLQTFPARSAAGIDIPSTPSALWLWLRGDDSGELLRRGQSLSKLLSPAFELEQAIDGFRYDIGRDLSGYEDGTENPTGDDAITAAIISDSADGLNGSSFVAVQQWRHDFAAMDAMSTSQRDLAIGRRISDNEEIDDAPESAHVKRTAQESFSPEAFVLRRSMPWTCGDEAGLVFVAFGHSFASFDTLLRHMIGADDGVQDALFRFTRPTSGAYFWCPAVANGQLQLDVIGI